MTREEAIKYLIMPTVTSTEVGEVKQKEIDAYNMANKALKQEPCEDAVSRQAVLDSLHNKFADGFDSDRWWNSMSVLYAINKVPSVRPQEQKGHWIIHSDYDAMECDKCGKGFSEYDYNDFNYCPNCGCRMVNL